jgi:hypothetical protein
MAAAGALLAAGAASAADGPFGIAMGSQAAQLDGARRFKPGWYTVTPPRPDGQFRQVAVEAFRSTGVCVVQAASPTIADDADGAKVRAAIDRLAETYSATLGKPEKLDSCKSLICAPELWGEDLLAGDRRYGYRWQLRGGQIPKVREVSLVAVARSVSSFTYLVEYQSDALTACHANEGALD